MDLVQIGPLLDEYRPSAAIRSIIAQTLATRIAGGGPIDVGAFLDGCVAFGRVNPGTAAERFSLAVKLYIKPQRPRARIDETTPVSEGLQQVFLDAQRIRRATRGKDIYLGVRHLIFSALTSENDLIAIERRDWIRDRDTKDLTDVLRDLALFIQESLERGESWKVWEDVFHERGLGHLLPPPREERTARAKVSAATGTARGRATVTGVSGANVIAPSAPKDTFAVVRSDDPWADDAEDHFGATNEARAFAMTVCAADVRPPLAFGVFGDWGSGKSFFLRLIRDNIRLLTRESRRKAERGEPTPLLGQVVQIQFNAWHYVETNLWASLVHHIFTQLDAFGRTPEDAEAALLDRLKSARELTRDSAEELVARRREQKQAASDLKQAVGDLAAEQTAIWTAVAKELWNKLGRRKETQEALEIIGAPATATDARAVGQALETLGTEAGRIRKTREASIGIATSPPFMVLTVLAMILAPAVIAAIGASLFEDPLMPAALGGLLAPVAVAFAVARKRAEGAVKAVAAFRDTYEKAVAEAEKASRTKVRFARVKEAEARLEEANVRLTEAVRDYNESTGKGRLLKFVRDRAGAKDYESHLSLVATVRRDFEELSVLLRKAGAAEAKVAEKKRKDAVADEEARLEAFIAAAGGDLTDEEIARLRSAQPRLADATAFERVVLYIDDLDRCPPDQVVKVLQAIHLLLAFPLFVVFVAVDLRWLRNSLIKHYGNLIGVDPGGDTASPGDYLEKIFQTPYWVRPMHADQTSAFMEAQLGAAPTPAQAAAARQRRVDQERAIAMHRADGVYSGPGSSIKDGALSYGPAREELVENLPGEPAMTQSPAFAPEALAISDAERAFIGDLSPHLGGSPRRALRFLNVYRIIKASLSADDRHSLETGGYAYLLALLAVSVGNERAGRLLHGALRAATPSRTIGGLWADMDESDSESPPSELARRAQIRARLLRERKGGKVADLAHWAPLAARFDFDDLLGEMRGPRLARTAAVAETRPPPAEPLAP